MINKYFIVFIVVYTFMCSGVSAEFEKYKGDENDPDEIVNYLKKNFDTYFTTMTLINEPSKKDEVLKLQAEMQRLVLRIDAGEIKNNKHRRKVVAIRRNALKNANRGIFVITNFDRRGKNQMGGKMGAEYEGEAFHISPWIDYSLVQDGRRVGKRILRLEYDVMEGEALLYNEVKKNRPLKEYNAIGFRIKGDAEAIKVQFVASDGMRYEYVVRGVTEEWQTIVVPFKDLSNFESFYPEKIDRINLVLSDEFTMQKKGSLFLDDLILRNIVVEQKKITKKAVMTYNVEGGVPLGTNKSFLRTRQ